MIIRISLFIAGKFPFFSFIFFVLFRWFMEKSRDVKKGKYFGNSKINIPWKEGGEGKADSLKIPY